MTDVRSGKRDEEDSDRDEHSHTRDGSRYRSRSPQSRRDSCSESESDSRGRSRQSSTAQTRATADQSRVEPPCTTTPTSTDIPSRDVVDDAAINDVLVGLGAAVLSDGVTPHESSASEIQDRDRNRKHAASGSSDENPDGPSPKKQRGPRGQRGGVHHRKNKQRFHQESSLTVSTSERRPTLSVRVGRAGQRVVRQDDRDRARTVTRSTPDIRDTRAPSSGPKLFPGWTQDAIAQSAEALVFQNTTDEVYDHIAHLQQVLIDKVSTASVRELFVYPVGLRYDPFFNTKDVLVDKSVFDLRYQASLTFLLSSHNNHFVWDWAAFDRVLRAVSTSLSTLHDNGCYHGDFDTDRIIAVPREDPSSSSSRGDRSGAVTGHHAYADRVWKVSLHGAIPVAERRDRKPQDKLAGIVADIRAFGVVVCLLLGNSSFPGDLSRDISVPMRDHIGELFLGHHYKLPDLKDFTNKLLSLAQDMQNDRECKALCDIRKVIA